MAAPEERNSFVMPDLVGQSEDDAVNEIVGAGLRVSGIKTQPASPAQTNAGDNVAQAPREVLRTFPAAGQRVYEGQGIGLEVSQ